MATTGMPRRSSASMAGRWIFPRGEHEVRLETHDGLDTDTLGDESPYLAYRSDLRRIRVDCSDAHHGGPSPHGEEPLRVGRRQRDDALGEGLYSHPPSQGICQVEWKISGCYGQGPRTDAGQHRRSAG